MKEKLIGIIIVVLAALAVAYPFWVNPIRPGEKIQLPRSEKDIPFGASSIYLEAENLSLPSAIEVAATLPVETLYEVWQGDHQIEVSRELQLRIQELAAEHDYPFEIIYGLIVVESGFNPSLVGDQGRSFGLAQIQRYWLTAPSVEPYRLTTDYASRDLLDPEHNLLTLFEIWNWAREAYRLDPYDPVEMRELLYWHNSGQDPRGVGYWLYSERCFEYAEALKVKE